MAFAVGNTNREVPFLGGARVRWWLWMNEGEQKVGFAEKKTAPIACRIYRVRRQLQLGHVMGGAAAENGLNIL